MRWGRLFATALAAALALAVGVADAAPVADRGSATSAKHRSKHMKSGCHYSGRAAKGRAAKRRAKACRVAGRSKRPVPLVPPNPGSRAPLPVPVVPAPGPIGPEPPAAVAPREPTPVQVSLKEWAVNLSRGRIAAGPTFLQLVNFGEDAHDLRVVAEDGTSPVSFAETEPHGVREQTVTLGPGRYKLLCTLSGHAALGMKAELIVSG
jgi:plastocyanin